MPDPLSPNVQHLKASETVAISNEAKRRKAAGEDVLDLGVGEPDFDTPAPAAQAGIQAIQKGLTRYPPNIGIVELRRAIARQLEPDVRRPGRGSRQHRGELGLQAVDLQRLLHALRTQGPGADPGAGLGVLPPDRAPLPGRAGAGAGRPRVGPQGQRQGPRPRATPSPPAV